MNCPSQFERVRVIYKYALDKIPKNQAQELFKYYTMFEKKFGDRRGIEDVIVSKRRFQYEEEVKVLPVQIHSKIFRHKNTNGFNVRCFFREFIFSLFQKNLTNMR